MSGGVMLYAIALAGKAILKNESLGGGDIKLGAMIGIYLGMANTLTVIFLAFFIGAVLGLGMTI